MKVILTSDIKGKGKKNSVITVADGYGSFLIKQGKAVLASEGNLKLKEEKDRQEQIEYNNKLASAEQLKTDLEKINLVIKAERNKLNDKIVQSINKQDISNLLSKNFNINIDKHKIELPEDLNKRVGKFKIKVKIFDKVTAQINLEVN